MSLSKIHIHRSPSRTPARGLRNAAGAALLGLLAASCAAETDSQSIVDVANAALSPTGDYVVVLRTGAREEGVMNGVGLARSAVRHSYRHALTGFAAHLTSAQLGALRNHPEVAFVEPDLRVYAIDELQPGVERIGTLSNPTADIDGVDERVEADIAIIDTGIDLEHPDLNVFYDQSFVVPGQSGDDDHWHGTHVAGIAAAKDDGLGVVGVAPGARLWALKVLDSGGYGTTADVIAGIDFVTQHAGEIEVANMSLGGWGLSSAERLAIQGSVAAGVVFVVAAGNDASDIFGSDGLPDVYPDFVPAAFPEVMTVSASVDTDGVPGGLGPSTGYGPDDTLATFSNFSASNRPDNPVVSAGAKIDVAAPGTNILSTVPGGGLGSASGTSMASPHVAGAVALYVASRGRATDAASVYAIRQAMVEAGEAQSAWRAGSTADPDANREPLVRVDRFVSSATLFSDDFGGGLAQWTESGEGDWNTEVLHATTGYPSGRSGAPAAHSDACVSGCTLELGAALDLRGFTSVELSLLRFVDVALDTGEFLRVDASDGVAWTTIASWGGGSGDDDRWHAEVFDLSQYAGVAAFRLRLVTKQNRTDEHVHVDDLTISAGTEVPAPVCGNGSCEVDESCGSCAPDCGACPAVCGNGSCEVGESCGSCASDCGACPAVCGNGSCEVGEGCADCSVDCGACPAVCGNGSCEVGESCVDCSVDCGACPAVCGNGSCEVGESCADCSVDCGACPAVCGNGSCEVGESCADCSVDCGACPPVCGNGSCESGESCGSCTSDCGACPPVCGNGSCEVGESCGSCASDCGACPWQTRFFDNFGSGLGQWVESGEGDWNTEALHEGTDYPGTGSGAPAAHSDACTAGCTLTLASALDLSSCAAASLELLRFADSGLDLGELVRVDVWDGAAWITVGIWQGGSGDDDRWHAESFDVSGYLASGAFLVRLVTQQNRTDEHVHIDDLRIKAAGCSP